MLNLLIELLVLCIIFGLVYWATTLIPLPPTVRVVVNVVMALIAIIFLLSLIGWVPWQSHHRLR